MFKMVLPVLCLWLLAFAAQFVGPAAAQGIIVPCGNIEGQWSWSTGGVVTIDKEGLAVWAPAVDAAPAFDGEWACNLDMGMLVIAWKQGAVDTLSLSQDGKHLEGQNQFGVAITADRYREQTAVAPAGPVPPRLVGTWVLEAFIGPVQPIWQIASDGAYRFIAGDLSHAGSMTAHGGTWTLDNATHGAREQGTYEFQNWATMVTSAKTGIGRWHRRETTLTLETLDLSGQKLPANLPVLVDRSAVVALRWRPDAILIELDYKRRSSAAHLKDEVKLRFLSPGSGAGLAVTVAEAGAGFFVHDAVSWSENEVPSGFLDLPAAWSIARQHGLQPPLSRAGLRIWTPKDQDPVLAWSLSAARGEPRGISLDAAEGIKLEGDLTGYVAAYNAQWQAAVAGLKRLFRQPRQRSSSSGSSFEWDSSSSSSDSDDSSSGSSSSGYDTASQGAWSAGDMGAYDRIQSGTATGDDCYRFGC